MMACLWAVIAYRMRYQTIFQEKANFGKFYDQWERHSGVEKEHKPTNAEARAFFWVLQLS